MTQPPPAPRDFSLSAVSPGVRFLLLFGGLWFAIGSLVAIPFTVIGQPVWVDWQLDSRGVTRDVTPVGVEAGNMRVNKRQVYDLTVDLEGHRTVVSTLESELIERARRGQSVRVTYDPENPGHARLEGERASVIGPFVLIPGFFVVAGAVLLAVAWSQVNRARALFKSGEAALARVLSVEATMTRINRQRVFRVNYEFRAVTQSVTGSYSTTNPPAADSELWVLYAPEDPKRNTPYAPR